MTADPNCTQASYGSLTPAQLAEIRETLPSFFSRDAVTVGRLLDHIATLTEDINRLRDVLGDYACAGDACNAVRLADGRCIRQLDGACGRPALEALSTTRG